MKSLLLAALTMCSLALSAQTITYKEYQAAKDSEGNYIKGYTGVEATSPWMTDGGSCRIGMFEGDVYKGDYNLSITIDNGTHTKIENTGNDYNCPINNQMRKIVREDNKAFIFIPFTFSVKGDESIVDHYEACCYIHEHNKTFPLLDATDNNGVYTGGKESAYLDEATKEPNVRYNIPVHDQLGVSENDYDAFYMTTSGNIITWAEGILVPQISQNNGEIAVTVYIRVHFKDENLKPVCYDMHSVQNHIKRMPIVTDIEDLNVDNNIAPVYYDLGGRVVNAEQMGKGIYIKRIGNKSEKVLVR